MTSSSYIALLGAFFLFLLGTTSAQDFDGRVQCFDRGGVETRAILKALPVGDNGGWRRYRLTLVCSTDNDTARALLVSVRLPKHAVWWDRSVVHSPNGPLSAEFKMDPDGTLKWRLQRSTKERQDFVLWISFSAPGEPNIEVIGEPFHRRTNV